MRSSDILMNSHWSSQLRLCTDIYSSGFNLDWLLVLAFSHYSFTPLSLPGKESHSLLGDESLSLISRISRNGLQKFFSTSSFINLSLHRAFPLALFNMGIKTYRKMCWKEPSSWTTKDILADSCWCCGITEPLKQTIIKFFNR